MGALSLLPTIWAAISSGAGKAFSFVKSSQPAQYLILFLVALFTYRNAIEETKKTVRREEQSRIRDSIRKANDDARKAVEEADRRAVRELNDRSLRELTERDPNNRGRPRRD